MSFTKCWPSLPEKSAVDYLQGADLMGRTKPLFLSHRPDRQQVARRACASGHRNEGGGAASLAPAFLQRILHKLGVNLDIGVVPATTSKEDEGALDCLTERLSVLLQATRLLHRTRFAGGVSA
ncbi:hypothetical protein J2S97_001991 [Arthrobacter oryzae]|nr:hypothetical protein [Arthrobacter oryzae]